MNETETRAAFIEHENSNPVIRERKEQLIEQILARWESWGIIKFKDNTPKEQQK